MKICITGAHSVGKTTLIKAFSEKHRNASIFIISEKAREAIKKGIPLGQNATIDSYIYYINQQLSAEISAEKSFYDILLADRSILDGLAHPIVNNIFMNAAFPEYFIDMFESILYFQKSFYDLYIYIPIEFDLVKDEVRPFDESYRIAIDAEVKRLLDKHIGKYVTLNGSIENRIQMLEKLTGFRV